MKNVRLIDKSSGVSMTPDSAGKIRDILIEDALPSVLKEGVLYLVKGGTTLGSLKYGNTLITEIKAGKNIILSVEENALVITSASSNINTYSLDLFNDITPESDLVYLITD